MGEQIAQISNETKNICVWPQLTKDCLSANLLMPTTTAGVISIVYNVLNEWSPITAHLKSRVIILQTAQCWAHAGVCGGLCARV